MTTDTIPREPTEYTLTAHAGNRYRERGIETTDITEVIAEGDMTRKGENRVYFEGDIYNCDRWEYVPVRVVVDPNDGEVITVHWMYPEDE